MTVGWNFSSEVEDSLSAGQQDVLAGQEHLRIDVHGTGQGDQGGAAVGAGGRTEGDEKGSAVASAAGQEGPQEEGAQTAHLKMLTDASKIQMGVNEICRQR